MATTVNQYYEIQFGVSLTPAISLTEGEGAATKVMDIEIKKSLGGSGVVGGVDGVTVTADGTDVVGYTAGAAAYLDSNAGPTAIGSPIDDGMVFVKNTGFEFGTSAALGDALTKTSSGHAYNSEDGWAVTDAIRISVDLVSGAVGPIYIAYLYPGEGLVLPRIPNESKVYVDNLSGSATIAVEYVVVS